MTKVKSTSQFNVHIQLELTEVEARALKAMTEYGIESFLSIFYEKLGSNYLQPHEDGVRSLFSTVKSELQQHLNKVDDLRGVWNGTKIATSIKKL